MKFTRLFVVAALFAVGCSKPAEVVDAPAVPTVEIKPTASTPPVGPIAPAATPTASTPPAIGPPLERTMADAWANIQNRGFKLEAAKPYDPSAGPSVYKVKGAPAIVVFREHNGDLISVEAIISDGIPKMSDERIIDFATTVGESSTGLTGVVRRVIAQAFTDVQLSQRGLSETIARGSDHYMLDVTRHDDGGYSFKFWMKAVAK